MNDGSLRNAKVEWWIDNGDYPHGRANVRIDIDGRAEERAAFDFYKAFQDARESFESEGCRFHCYGASLNVWPSGMARDMGVGYKAYKLNHKRHTTLEDLVPIFDSGDDVIPATVKEQCAFSEKWHENMRKRHRARVERKWWQFWR